MMAHAHNRKTSQPRERKSLLGRKRTGAVRVILPACMCNAYESNDDAEYEACQCGHWIEEHGPDGCKGGVRP